MAHASPQARRPSRPRDASPQADAEIAGAASTSGELPDAVGYVVRLAQLAVFDDFIRSLAPVDLRPSQFSAMLIIERNPGLKQTEVSEALGIKRPNFVKLIDELERRGLARRRPVSGDRRSYALELTRAGQSCLRNARTLQAEHERRIASRLGPGGRKTLLCLLRAILHPPLNETV